MVADMKMDNEHGGPHKGGRSGHLTFNEPNFFEPKLTPACASSKLCEFIFNLKSMATVLELNLLESKVKSLFPCRKTSNQLSKL